MSLHKKYAHMEDLNDALRNHGLPVDEPSQNADCFRAGWLAMVERIALTGEPGDIEKAMRVVSENLKSFLQGDLKEINRFEINFISELFDTMLKNKGIFFPPFEQVGEMVAWPDDFNPLGVDWSGKLPPSGTKLFIAREKK